MTARLLTNIGRLWTGLGDPQQRRHRDQRRPHRLGRPRPPSCRAASPASSTTSSTWTWWRTWAAAWSRPGLIDAHTHPVYAGNRYAELAMRSNGLSDRRDHRGGRRHLVHGHRDQGHRPLDAVQRRARAAGPLAAVRHDDDRGQDRLPPHQGRRAGRRADAPLARGRAGHAAGARHVHGRARGAAGVLRPPQRLHRRGVLLVRGRRRRRRGQRGRRLRGRPVHRGRGPLDPQRGPPRRACCRGCTPAATRRTGAARVAAELGCASADLLHDGDRRRRRGAVRRPAWPP